MVSIIQSPCMTLLCTQSGPNLLVREEVDILYLTLAEFLLIVRPFTSIKSILSPLLWRLLAISS